MIKVLIPPNPEFKIFENQLKNMYKNRQKRICDTNSFEFIRDNTLFYMFVDNNKLLGAIYYFMDEGKLFLNAFAGRKHFKENLDCLKWSTTWFQTDIYAKAQNRASAISLYRCGFKYLKDEDLFVFNCYKNYSV